jgi:hypothetical protein
VTLPEGLVVVAVLGLVEESLAEGGDARGVREHLLVHRLSLNLNMRKTHLTKYDVLGWQVECSAESEPLLSLYRMRNMANRLMVTLPAAFSVLQMARNSTLYTCNVLEKVCIPHVAVYELERVSNPHPDYVLERVGNLHACYVLEWVKKLHTRHTC